MVKFVVTIGPAPGGVGVNCRPEGAPANPVEEFWYRVIGSSITDAMKKGSFLLEKAGVTQGSDVAQGEAARLRGEQRNGDPAAHGGN